MNFRKLNLFYILAIIVGALVIWFIWNRLSVIEGNEEVTEPATGSPKPAAGSPEPAASSPEPAAGAGPDAVPKAGPESVSEGGGGNVDATTIASAAAAAVVAAVGGGGDSATIANPNSQKLSDAQDTIRRKKFEQIDQQIEQAVNYISNIYSNIPRSIEDIRAGAITTIPYNLLVKNENMSNFTINIIRKLDDSGNKVYYRISEKGVEPYVPTNNKNVTKFIEEAGEFFIIFPACIWEIDMTLPLGPKGDKGDPGDQGDPGDPGKSGDKGDTGFMGNWGTP